MKTFLLLVNIFMLPIMTLFCSTVQANSIQSQASIQKKSVLTENQQESIQSLIESTLKEKPEIIIQAIQTYQMKQMQKQKEKQAQALKENYKKLFEENDPFIGSAKPKLTLVYFTDYNCGFCKKQSPVYTEISKQFPDIKIIYKDLAILNETSVEAAELIRASFKINPAQYIDIHQNLMSHQGIHTQESIKKAFQSENIDIEKLKKNIDQNIIINIESTRGLASKIGINGTPALVLKNQVINGFQDFEQLSELINKELNN